MISMKKYIIIRYNGERFQKKRNWQKTKTENNKSDTSQIWNIEDKCWEQFVLKKFYTF
jgi:hypothetical protein